METRQVKASVPAVLPVNFREEIVVEVNSVASVKGVAPLYQVPNPLFDGLISILSSVPSFMPQQEVKSEAANVSWDDAYTDLETEDLTVGTDILSMVIFRSTESIAVAVSDPS